MLPVLLFVLFLLFPAPVSAQTIGTCPDEKEIKQNANAWRDSQPEFRRVPPSVPGFYDPYLNKNFPKNTHLDTAMLPNPNNIACLIAYAEEEWHDQYGTHFDKQGVETVINFAIQNNYNPSLLLALWAEETHGGDQSAIELGCGAAAGLDAQLRCLTGIDSKYKLNSFACFLGSYAGDTPVSLNCGYGDPDGVVTNPDFPYIIQYYNYVTKGVKPGQSSPPPITPTNFTTHPLRPNPKDPISAAAPLTTYCAMRPTTVEQNRFDVRLPTINIKTRGTLTQDFTNFITPLLSITNPKKADYSLPFSDKAQRYLADFLEGRAYYEPQVEPANPTPQQAADLFNRLGVFRKLAPKTYQDELKRAMIQRAAGTFINSDNPYDFPPASATVHNYTVASWQGQPVTLKDFVNHWAPLPKDFDQNHDAYTDAYETWKNLDAGKWYQLWPYVPMFTREDSTGFIQIIDSNPPPEPYSPSGQYIEENSSSTNNTEVSHPHLARTYEVATSLSYLLTPQAVHEGAVPPELGEEWFPKLWEDSMWWLDPSYAKPKIPDYGFDMGPLCDVDPSSINLISSSGDTASDDTITTSVWREDLQVDNPEYDPRPADPDDAADCGAQYACEKCKEKKTNVKDQYGNIIGTTLTYAKDESACYYYKQVRSDPDYLITYTPFLTEILTSLTGSQRAIFDIFKPAGQEKKQDEVYDWPGVGNAGEESPQYGFSAGKAEAGARKPGDSQSYYYRYLGSLQCAKERVLMTLQPFITGQSYTPYAYDCFPELTPPTTGPVGPLPTGPQWLQWPCAGAYVEDERLSVCYQDPRRPAHAGLDLQCPNGIIHPSAPGTVVAVNNSPGAHGFGIYVIIDHGNGWSTLYAHLQSTSVSVGQQVNLNTPIGRQDNTGSWSFGSHLHLGLAHGNNPANFLVSGPTADPCAAIQGCSCSP